MSPYLLVVLLFSGLIGYSAQVTGLCLVRGVSDWSRGQRLRLLAILSSGFWVYFYFPLAHLDLATLHLAGYGFHWAFLIGGAIFGVGAALNGACSVSTATRLSSGDISMLFTIAGWLLGWLLFDYIGVHLSYRVQDFDKTWLAWVATAGLITACAAVYWRNQQLWPLWSGITLVGVLAGAVFLYQPAWSPSDFVRDLGLAIVKRDAAILPGLDRVGILIFMLLGMALGAWRHRRFRWVWPDVRSVGKHLGSGVLMGLGSTLALGGNDFQLLLALPAVSPAAFLATLGMLLGIRLGLILIERQQTADALPTLSSKEI
tara:strand:- start:24925 stop:25872 length:948 start_codon:yes stop_codon:yes gene_type:complete